MVKKSKSIIFMALYMLLGAAVGFLLVYGRLNKGPISDFSPWIRYDYDLIFGIVAISCLIMMIWNVIGLVTISTVPNNLQEDTEGRMTPQERKLGTLLKISAFNQIIAFIWGLLAIIQFISITGTSVEEENFLLINVLVGSIVIIITVILQFITMKSYNKMYPDRTVNLSALNGQRELFQKLDDGEQWIVYRSAYKAFHSVTVLLIVGILFFFVYSLLFTPAPLPIIVLAIILISQRFVYFREATRLSDQA